jgi:hypothetical protein
MVTTRTSRFNTHLSVTLHFVFYGFRMIFSVNMDYFLEQH